MTDLGKASYSLATQNSQKINSIIPVTNLNTGFNTGAAVLSNTGCTISWLNNDNTLPVSISLCPKILKLSYTGTGGYVNVGKVINFPSGYISYASAGWIKLDSSQLVTGLGRRIRFQSGNNIIHDVSINVSFSNLSIVGYTTSGATNGASYTFTVQAIVDSYAYVSIVVKNISLTVNIIYDYWQPTTTIVSNGVTGAITLACWVIIPKNTISYYNSYPDTVSGDTIYPYQNKRIMFLGDSITALGDWINIFNSILKPSSYVNVAVSSATWRDKTGTVYDGNPVSGGTDNNVNNVMGNQVQKILNNDYTAPDIIIIAAGTNDSMPDNTVVESQFTNAGSYIPLTAVDRTTFPGAMRYVIETLENTYPIAQIFICLPIQSAEAQRTFATCIQRDTLISTIANRLAVPVINTNQCGIYGAYEANGPWVGNPSLGSGRDLRDGLHPNLNGAQKLGAYIARAIINWFCF